MVAGSPAKCVGGVRGNPAAAMMQWTDNLVAGSGARSDTESDDGGGAVIKTDSGSRVRRFSSADYSRLRDAEAALLGTMDSASFDSGEDAVARGASSSSSSGGELASVGAASTQPAAPVDATMSDVEAAEKWGPSQAAPEFFI
jgi:hypothetical protein